MKKSVIAIIIVFAMLLSSCGTQTSGRKKVDDDDVEVEEEEETKRKKEETSEETTEDTTEETTTEETTTTKASMTIDEIYDVLKAAGQDEGYKTSNKTDTEGELLNVTGNLSFVPYYCWSVYEFKPDSEILPQLVVGAEFTFPTSDTESTSGTVAAINGRFVLTLYEVDEEVKEYNYLAPYTIPTAQAVYDAFVGLDL